MLDGFTILKLQVTRKNDLDLLFWYVLVAFYHRIHQHLGSSFLFTILLQPSYIRKVSS